MTAAEILELGKRRCEELGLKCYLYVPECYLADDIHKLLGSGVEHFGLQESGSNWGTYTAQDTHKGLLIGVRPIVSESEERSIDVKAFIAATIRQMDELYKLMIEQSK